MIRKKIDDLREKLNMLAETNDKTLTEEEIIAVSQRMDELIIDYYENN